MKCARRWVFFGGGAYLVTVVAGGGGGGGGGRGTDLFPGSSSLSPSFTLSCSSLTVGRNALKIGPTAFKTGICLFLNALFVWFLPFCELFAPNQKSRFDRVRSQQMKSFFSVYVHVTPLHYSEFFLYSFLNYRYVLSSIICVLACTIFL